MKFHLIVLAVVFSTACSSTSKVGYSGHGADSVPQEVIEKFAPKPIPANKLARIESLLDIRSPGMGMVSPDGKKMFFSWSVTGTSQVWKLDRRGAFPVQMTGGQDGTRLRDITPDGRFLVLTRDEKGNEYPYLYIQSVNGGQLQLVAGKKKVITTPQFVSKDSKYLYYTMNDTNPTLHSLYRYNLRTRKSEKVFKGIKGYMFVSDYKPNGELLLGNATGNTSREYYLFNIKTKKLTPLLGQNEKESYRVSFGKRPGEYIVQTNKFGEFHRLYSFKKGQWTPITPEAKYNISGFSIDHNFKRILYTINKDGYTEVKGLTASNYRPIRVPFARKNNILHVFSGYTTRNSRFTVFGLEKVNAPRASYVYDWNTKKYKQWVFPSSPEINTAQFVAPSLEYYTARDGTKIPMFVRRPQQCKNKLCPVIVQFHGGPESQSKPYFSPITQIYMDEGFVMVYPNVRGSRGYGKTWLHSDNGPKRLKVITDIEDAGLYIKKNWAVNGVAPKIGVFGGSYGGYSTNVAMTMFAGTYDAGVTVVGMSSLVTFLNNTGPFRRHLRTSEYGDPEKDMEALQKLSPINYLDKIQDPLLVIHGATDPRVPAGEGIQIYEAMKAKGIDGDLILFPDEGHGVRKRKNRAIYYASTIEFFKKHLKKQ